MLLPNFNVSFFFFFSMCDHRVQSSLYFLCVFMILSVSQSVLVLADNPTDNCCDVPLFCPTPLKLLAGTKMMILVIQLQYPKFSQQERQEQD